MGECGQQIQSSLTSAQRYVQELKEKYKNFSSAQIAKLINLPQPTFNKVENGQTKNPSLATVSKLLSGLGKSHKISEAIEVANPALADAIKENLSHNIETPLMGADMTKYFSQTQYRSILLLALTRSGTTRDEITFEYGNSGIRLLDEMIKANLLTEVRGVIKADEEKVTFDQYILKDAMVDCITNNYDADKFGTGANLGTFQTESVDLKKAMPVIRKKLLKTYKEIKEEILYSPKYFGNDKVFIAMVTDSLIKSHDDSTEVKQ